MHSTIEITLPDCKRLHILKCLLYLQMPFAMLSSQEHGTSIRRAAGQQSNTCKTLREVALREIESHCQGFGLHSRVGSPLQRHCFCLLMSLIHPSLAAQRLCLKHQKHLHWELLVSSWPGKCQDFCMCPLVSGISALGCWDTYTKLKIPQNKTKDGIQACESYPVPLSYWEDLYDLYALSQCLFLLAGAHLYKSHSFLSYRILNQKKHPETSEGYALCSKIQICQTRSLWLDAGSIHVVDFWHILTNP